MSRGSTPGRPRGLGAPATIAGALAIALLAVPLVAAPRSTIRIGLLNRTATNWALYAGIDQKFFAAEGVLPEVTYASASEKLAADLVEGRVDVGNMAAGNVVALVGKGQDLVIVMGVNRPVFSLMAHPRIKRPQDLRGARIGVDNGRAGYVHLVRRYLAANGIEACRVALVPVGGVDARHRAMLAGDIDAALLSPPRDLDAIDKGYTMLADVAEEPEHYTGSTAVTRRAWAAANRDTLVAYLRGYKRALDWLYDGANADAASRLLARELSLPEAQARRIYDSSITRRRWLVRDGMVHSEGMRQVAREMDPNAPFRFEDYVDLGFWRAAAGGQGQPPAGAGAWTFRLEEATIADVHRAIRQGQLTCQRLVQAYIDRARAYNGTCNRPVTEDMLPDYLPRYGEYLPAVTATARLPPGDPRRTPGIEVGRLEPSASDPDVPVMLGMTVGMPGAGQLRALGTINLRGERSTTCKGACDRKDGRPATCPKVCSEFSRLPDALEQAAALDARHGSSPNLVNLPMYCLPFSFKDVFDTKDMRTTAGGDTRYDIDFPARDHTLVAQLRKKGAIIYGKSTTKDYNGLAGDPGGPNVSPTILPSETGYQRSTWAGNPCNPYDTTRAASLGSSSGSGVSVGANLVMCGVCEETRASCRGPANHNAVALILPHKSMISYLGGAVASDIYNDRSGIHCRSVVDAAKVLDALKDPVDGYYDSRDIFTTVPRSTIPTEPFSTAITSGRAGALREMRIGIVREFMVKHVKADEPIVEAAAAEMKSVLGKHLGATLVESVTPGWADDPEIENLSVSFDEAIAQIVPVLFPELLFRLNRAKEPVFPAFAAKIEPTEFAPGVTRGTGTMPPVDWMVRWAEGLEAAPPNLTLRSVIGTADSRAFRFQLPQYLLRRAKDWAARGYTETVVDFPTLNARSKFWWDHTRAAFKNWEQTDDIRNGLAQPQGIAERIQVREMLRRVMVKVMRDNKLDLMINLHTALPPGKIGLAGEPVVNDRRASFAMGPNAGITEMLVPAGYVRTVYDPTFELATDEHGRKFYRGRTGTTPTTVPAPGLPFSISFWSEPGMELLTLKAASAYEAASRRRTPPPAFTVSETSR